MEPKPDQTFSNSLRGAMAGAEWWRGDARSDANAETANFEDLELVQVFPTYTGPTIEELGERLKTAGWSVDDIGDDVVLRASKDFPEDLFTHRLYISNRNPLIPATVMFIEEGFETDGAPVYTIGPTMTEETLDALILCRTFQKSVEVAS